MKVPGRSLGVLDLRPGGVIFILKSVVLMGCEVSAPGVVIMNLAIECCRGRPRGRPVG